MIHNLGFAIKNIKLAFNVLCKIDKKYVLLQHRKELFT